MPTILSRWPSMSGLAEETPRSIVDTLARHIVPCPSPGRFPRCRPVSPGVLIPPDNATVPDMRPEPCPPWRAPLPLSVLVEGRRKRPYFRNTKNSEEI